MNNKEFWEWCKPRIDKAMAQDMEIEFSLSDYKEILERNYALLANESNDSISYNLGLSVICHVAENLPDNSFIRYLLYDCIVKSRIFLYNEMLAQKYNNIQGYNGFNGLSEIDIFSESYYITDSSGSILTRDQKRLFDSFQEKRRIIVSAPTSFGKSRIIQEIVIHNSYGNILIILPTIALLNETFVRFKQNELIANRYNIYNTIGKRKFDFPANGNIFILTPEKTDLLLDEHGYLKFDFFTMDEIYKIQDGDERSKIFTNCLYRLSKSEGIIQYT